MPVLKDIAGQRFGRLVVLERHDLVSEVRWRCQCDCGGQTIARGSQLRSGKTQSCGCRKNERLGALHRKHGLFRLRAYRAWQMARHRCHNPNNVAFADYGGRGIAMCEQWREDFPAFLAAMGDCPPGLTLDRIDPNRGYEPGNCRWATTIEQTLTRRNTRLVEWGGESTTIGAVARLVGIPRTTLYGLVGKGMGLPDAVMLAKQRARRPRRLSSGP
jgi:hypothetical protein